MSRRQTGFAKLVTMLRANGMTVNEDGLKELLKMSGIDPEELQDAQIPGLVNQLLEQLANSQTGALVAAPVSSPVTGNRGQKNLTVPTMPVDAQAANQQGSTAGMGAIAQQVERSRQMTGQILQGLDAEAIAQAQLLYERTQSLPHDVLNLVGLAYSQGGAADDGHFQTGIGAIFAHSQDHPGLDATPTVA
jgi:hypothetical protein